MPEQASTPSPELEQLRNMEEFASLAQWLHLFGTDVLGLPDSFNIEDLETELFTSSSEIIVGKIGLGLLRLVSSHRGLVPNQFEEYTRRQYASRKPGKPNPFGDETDAMKFDEMDVFARVRILHQLSVWTFEHPEKIRDKIKLANEKDQLQWRMEPVGYDRNGNTYYILDDDRLYRRTRWVAEPSPKKGKAKKKASKRRRVSAAEEEAEGTGEVPSISSRWSCVCVSLHDWTVFVRSFDNSKNADEKAFCKYLKEDVIPNLTKSWLEKEKQRQLQDAVANRKRSSRIDAKLTRRREEEQKAAAAKKEAEVAAAAKKLKLEAERKEKDREQRAILRQEKLKAQTHSKTNSSRGTSADDSSSSGVRRSSRNLKAEPLKAESEDWAFDCICGAHGMNYEDGSEIIACDSCDVWQHLKCVDLPPGGEDADFICNMCLRSNEPVGQSELPRSPQIIKLRVGPPSPEKARGPFGGAAGSAVTANGSSKRSEPTEPTAMDIEEDNPVATGNSSSGNADVVSDDKTQASPIEASGRKQGFAAF